MQLIGQTVKHSAFGKGIVTGLSSDRVTINFSAGEKRFKKTAEHFYRYYCKLNLLQPGICDANNKSEA